MSGAPFPTPSAAEVGALLRGDNQAELEVPDEDQATPTESGSPPDASPPELDATPEQDGDAAQSAASSDAQAEPATEGDAEGDGDQVDDELGGMTVRELADKLGVKAAELYNQVRVGLPDGRGEVTLDELKQGYLAHADLEDERSAFTLERSEYTAARDANQLEDLRNRQELQTIMGFVQQLPRELLERAQQAHTESLAREGEALLAARPEWRDPAVRSAAAEEHMEALAEFGISRAEYQTVASHKLLLVADELCRLRRERKEALDELRTARERSREPAPRTGTRNAARGAAKRATRAKPNGQDQTVAAVGALIRGQ